MSYCQDPARSDHAGSNASAYSSVDSLSVSFRVLIISNQKVTNFLITHLSISG